MGTHIKSMCRSEERRIIYEKKAHGDATNKLNAEIVERIKPRI